MLLSLSDFLFERILGSFLSPRDYVQLSLTCRSIRTSTQDFLLHYANYVGRDDNVTMFFERNTGVLLPWEKHLYDCLENLQRAEPDLVVQKLPLYREILGVIPESARDVTRISVITSQVFSYLGDKDHVYVSYNEDLQRDVVYLREISWLMFSTELPKFHSDSFPAFYRIRLHLQIREDVIWKGDQPMVVRLLRCSDNEIIRHYFIHPRIWKGLAAGDKVDLSYNNYNDKHLRIVPAETASWYYLVIDNVQVKEGEEIKFSVDDRQNVFWKSGKSWDFLEIMRIR